jgi:isoamylase
VNFSIFSEHATGIGLCLFDSPEARSESTRIPLAEQTDMVWHCYLHGIRPGQLYGYRVYGAWNLQEGHRFNPAKVILDPYAKGIGRLTQWDDTLFGYKPGQPDFRDVLDSAPYAPLAAVIDTAFTWGKDRPSLAIMRAMLIPLTFTVMRPDTSAHDPARCAAPLSDSGCPQAAV